MPPKKSTCANPLFLQWLEGGWPVAIKSARLIEELRDAAREKGIKSAEVYSKGCRSLQQCPVRYERARDLSVLAGIGAKTISELDKKHRAHCAATGEPYPTDQLSEAPARKERSAQSLEHMDDEGEGSEGAEALPKKKRRVLPRTYIPAPRSGAYGILIGMLVAQENPDDAIDEQLTRGEIVRHAQAFCEASYDRSEKGTWVTAWNGMKTLVNKGYVSVQGMPHRYSLTHEGFDVAAVIRNMDDAFKDLPKLVPFRLRGDDAASTREAAAGPSKTVDAGSTATSSARPPLPRASSSATVVAQRSVVASSSSSSSGRFNFCYIDVRGRQVEHIYEARSRLCPEEFISLRRIEFLAHQRNHPIVKQLRLIDETDTLHPSGRITLFAYIVEDGAPPKCSGLSDDCATHSTAGAVKSVVDAPSKSKASGSEAASAPALSRGTSMQSSTATATLPQTRPIAGPSRTPSTLGPTASLGHHRLAAQMPLPGESRDTPDFDPADAIVFPQGSYEIILILDTREVESRDSRDKIQEALERKGVKVETRALRLGDMCWVARRLDSYGAEEDECVLDYVAERKRLDDLCISIKDGRYNEQCFRLGESGIRNVFYIVEDYQKSARMQFFGKAILTAKSQIQVINGFYLKETHKLNDTIDFLVTMTNVIKQLSRDLRVIPSRFIHRDSYTAFQDKLRKSHPDTAYLTSFEAFQTLNKKSSLRTVREYLARMLLRIKGMSPERVSAVLDVWETPRALYEAMYLRSQEGDRTTSGHSKPRGPEMMFADDVPGEGRRQIGNALSKEMWRVLWGNGPPQTAPRSAGASTAAAPTTASAASQGPDKLSKGKQKVGASNSDARKSTNPCATSTPLATLRTEAGQSYPLSGSTGLLSEMSDTDSRSTSNSLSVAAVATAAGVKAAAANANRRGGQHEADRPAPQRRAADGRADVIIVIDDDE